MAIQSKVFDGARSYDVCVIGAGPLGLATALECESLGLSVLVLESGGLTPAGSADVEPYGVVVDPSRHAPVDVAVCRALGGSSWWWGGRCVPMDPVDFEPRDFVPGSGWPISQADIAPYEATAAQYLDCGSNQFIDPHTSWAGLGDGVHVTALERWSRTREMALYHGERLRASQNIDVCLGTTVDTIDVKDEKVVGLLTESGQSVNAKSYVLAAGGLGTAKLLQRHLQKAPEAFGGTNGALGRYYMGHTHGKIADIKLDDPSDAGSLDFYLDDTGTWVRRRLSIDAETQKSQRILNTAFWVDNAAFHDYRHGSGILSAVYLALLIPPVGRLLVAEGIRRMHVGAGGNILRHLGNVVMHPLATALSAWQILRQRYVEKPRRPGFLIRNKSGRYALTYHGEQLPIRESAATLDPDGTLRVDLRFTRADAESVVKAHDLVDKSLRAAGKGRLEYHMPEVYRADAVLAQATDGFHQEGLVRMGMNPATSVVDAQCRVHGLANLYVASTGIFPTSGQANPTFTACALAVRLAHFIAAKGGEHASN